MIYWLVIFCRKFPQIYIKIFHFVGFLRENVKKWRLKGELTGLYGTLPPVADLQIYGKNANFAEKLNDR